jgi:hypothetical protein
MAKKKAIKQQPRSLTYDVKIKKARRIKFKLEDCGQRPGPDIEGRIDFYSHCVDIHLNGYGTSDMADGYGSPLALDYCDGKVQVLVWSDINSQEPDKINLENALETNREPSDDDIDDAWSRFVGNHIQPSRLHAIATIPRVEQTKEETNHFGRCKLCCRILRAYQGFKT